ncbi:MAG: single-stranded-DNA-specific exonuclease RecJ [Patescibacteria group bacterium]|nr:MAG: single-stranded-DNA-specific exonuclease RecJ [Patescibacteria group bacterium]
MSKRWCVLNPRFAGSRRPSVESVVDLLLENRKVQDREDFFNPPDPAHLVTQLASYFPDLNLNQLAKAVKRVKKAIKEREKITIWGDYDVDGISATALLWQALYGLGANVLPYIPDRFGEGYGLNVSAIKKLSEEGTRLIITVDSGITAREAVHFANSVGVEVIITDHHVKPKVLPPALATVHTTRLCGTGVAWLLASQLVRGSQRLMAGLDLVAIATVADLQPLLGANRSLAAHGFRVLNQAKRPGLVALAEVSRLKFGSLGSYAAGWVLGPRINAVGRMKHGIEALRLLCTPNLTKARELAHLLDSANTERKALTLDMFDHAKKLVGGKAGLIVVYHDSWHEGVIGLVAGKLVEEFGRPSVVIARGDGFSKGSARSINGLNIVEILRNYDGLLEDVGGHEAAAGFTIRNENLEQFVAKLREETEETVARLDPRPVLKIDAELPLEGLSYDLVYALESLQPYGIGNPEPLFVAKGVTVLSERTVGRSKQHLKLNLAPGLEAIWFGGGDKGGFGRSDTISIVYTPQIERWGGKERIVLRIRDLRALR